MTTNLLADLCDKRKGKMSLKSLNKRNGLREKN